MALKTEAAASVKRRRRQQKEPENMANTATTTATNDDLAGLGLDLDVTALDTTDNAPKDVAVATPAATVDASEKATVEASDAAKTAETEAHVAKQTRTQIDVGNIDIEEDVPLIALVRQSGGSKYKFDDLRAPVKKADGSFSYASMRIDLGDNEEAAIKRSVQAATSQENKKHKNGKGGLDGHDIYFITRSVVEKGKFTGIRVYRVDGTIEKEDTK